MGRATTYRNHPAVGLVAPVVLTGLAAALAAEWAHWLASGSVVALALAPAAGVALAALLVLPPRRWAAPLVVTAVAVGAVDLAHGLPTELAVGSALAAPIGALVAALLLHLYARTRFQLARVRDLFALVVVALAGGAVGASVTTLALVVAGHRARLWPVAYHAALADALGLVLVPAAVLTVIDATRPGRRRAGRTEAALLAAAVLAACVLAIGHWADPLAMGSVVLLVWAALRFGPEGVALAGLAMTLAAAWSAARATGPFGAVTGGPGARALVVLTFAAATLPAMLALALALDERDDAEQRRWVASERFRRTFHDAPIGMVVATLDGQIVETNRELRRMLRYPDDQLVGVRLRTLRADDSGEHEVPRVWPTGPESTEQAELKLLDSRGEVVWVEVTETRLRHHAGAPEFKIVALVDVTDRKALQVQLVHAQKMESVGRLAGGIAHDFNNVLAIMRGQVELLQDDLAIMERARARIDSVQRATDRAAALTDDLMAFSRRRIDEPVPFDLHELLVSSRELLHQVLGPTLALELVLDASSPTIVADPNRIEQAVLNLAVNARDAMASGGTLTISTCTGNAPTHPVVLRVADTGAGMDAATRARIFEPFFTTKPPGQGTGLGLSTTEDIVRAAGGAIDVESQLGCGTTFVLTFPALEADVPEVGGSPVDDSPIVLVVDDEPEVRTLVTEILQGSGYRVVAAPDGAAALTMLERASRPVDLLVTDVVMPVMSGTDLAARVTERSPSTRVLFVSGFVPAGSAALRGAPLVAKPLHRAELLDAVERVLEGYGTKR